MSEETKQEKVTLHLTWTDHAPKKLSARIEEFKRRNGRVELDDRVAAIQFLRGTAGRATFVLPALYLALVLVLSRKTLAGLSGRQCKRLRWNSLRSRRSRLLVARFSMTAEKGSAASGS